MKLAITGASGFVGRQLVPLLTSSGVKLLLLGRSPGKLQQLYPGIQVCPLDALSEQGKDFDLVLHLAAHNNNQPGTQAEFDATNVTFAVSVLQSAQKAGIPRFIYVSSVHALNYGNHSAYAESKRRGAESLLKITDDIEVSVLYLPAVRGHNFSGKLGLLNHLPPFMRRHASRALASLRPTASIDEIAGYLLSGAPTGEDRRLILSEDQTGNTVYTLVMRFIDYAFALSIVVFFWWMLVGAYVAVKLDSKGPGLFGQPRIGLRGKVFTCWKFRTMQVGTAQAGTHEISAASVTRVGAFLRRTKIDELPQIWNILRGEMALIGPRPSLPIQTELIKERRERGVLEVLPGISGLAQVEGVDMSDPVRLARRDAEYIALRGIIPDLGLIVKTARGCGRGDRTSR